MTLLKFTHTSKFFDVPNGILEFRHTLQDGVSGHFKSWDKKRYHNTANLIVDDKLEMLGLQTLFYYTLGSDITQHDKKVAIEVAKQAILDLIKTESEIESWNNR